MLSKWRRNGNKELREITHQGVKMKSGDIVKINSKAASYYKKVGGPLVKIDLIGKNLTVELYEMCDDREVKVRECKYLFYKYELEFVNAGGGLIKDCKSGWEYNGDVGDPQYEKDRKKLFKENGNGWWLYQGFHIWKDDARRK